MRCPITAFGGETDRSFTKEMLAQWSALTSGTFGVRMFSGGHFYLDEEREQVVEAVLKALML